VTDNRRVADKRSPGARLLALVLHPVTPPLWLGIVVAAVCIAVEGALALYLGHTVPGSTFGVVFLFGVLVVSAGWGFTLAAVTAVISALVYYYVHRSDGGGLIPILVFLPMALLASTLAGQARLRTAEADRRRREAEAATRALEESRRESERFFELASDMFLIAAPRNPRRVNPALQRTLGYTAEELLSRPFLERVHPDDLHRTRDAINRLVIGNAPVQFENRCVRKDGEERWLEWNVAADEGMLYGAARDVTERRAEQQRLQEAYAELTESRKRIVAASDQARRRFERDLHDGAQQRLVSLSLQLRTLEADMPQGMTELREQVAGIIGGLAEASADLQALSRGIHPAVLSKGGIGPAVKALARRSPVPVVLDVELAGARPPESVEVGAYYVVAEALTNAAKHARAEQVDVLIARRDGLLDIVVRDDGAGGADTGRGSGLIGLADRVAALGGTLRVDSPPGRGTTLRAEIPISL